MMKKNGVNARTHSAAKTVVLLRSLPLSDFQKNNVVLGPEKWAVSRPRFGGGGWPCEELPLGGPAFACAAHARNAFPSLAKPLRAPGRCACRDARACDSAIKNSGRHCERVMCASDEPAVSNGGIAAHIRLADRTRPLGPATAQRSFPMVALAEHHLCPSG